MLKFNVKVYVMGKALSGEVTWNQTQATGKLHKRIHVRGNPRYMNFETFRPKYSLGQCFQYS